MLSWEGKWDIGCGIWRTEPFPERRLKETERPFFIKCDFPFYLGEGEPSLQPFYTGHMRATNLIWELYVADDSCTFSCCTFKEVPCTMLAMGPTMSLLLHDMITCPEWHVPISLFFLLSLFFSFLSVLSNSNSSKIPHKQSVDKQTKLFFFLLY